MLRPKHGQISLGERLDCHSSRKPLKRWNMDPHQEIPPLIADPERQAISPQRGYRLSSMAERVPMGDSEGR